MLYRIGTVKEIFNMPDCFPEPVQDKLYEATVVLEDSYGVNRDYLRTGGYSLLAQTKEDVEEIRKTIDFEEHPCEWADRIGEYLSALYLMNDDYSIVVFMPIAVAPKTLLEELED